MTDHWQWSFMAVIDEASRLQEGHATPYTNKKFVFIFMTGGQYILSYISYIRPNDSELMNEPLV